MKLSKGLITLLVLLAVVFFIFIWAKGAYNSMVSQDEQVTSAWSQVENVYQRRSDLIPNLVETVKGYAAHEAGTLEKVVQARNMAASATNMEDKIQGENMLQGTLKSLFAIAEAYPDLKANQNFMDLQAQLQRLEDEIANARKYYNAIVKEFNTKTESFPSNIIAGIFKFTRKPMFEVNEEAEREAVKVQF